MRPRSLLPLCLLLVDCGSKQDLVIGEIAAGAASSGVSGAAGTAGQASGGTVTAAAGTAGSAPLGGATALAGAPTGEAGMGGRDDDECSRGDEPPTGSLLHRYSFDGTGTVATDSVGDAHGEVIGTMLDGAGSVSMNGESRQYVDLPNGIVSSLSNLTVVTWMGWSRGAAYQRVFDFGASTDGEGLGSSGLSYVAVMPATGFEDQAKPGLGAEIKAPGFPTVTLASTEDMEERLGQVALVFESGVRASLYLDGVQLATATTAITLADIEDVNNWVGQSQYEDNPFYRGSYRELRIYDAALSACQIHTLLVAGPEDP
jgi:hypothetical protein